LAFRRFPALLVVCTMDAANCEHKNGGYEQPSDKGIESHIKTTETESHEEEPRSGHEPTSNPAEKSDPPTVEAVGIVDLSTFTEEELSEMPVVFAYVLGDKESKHASMTNQRKYYEELREQQNKENPAEQASPSHTRRIKKRAEKSTGVTSQGVTSEPTSKSSANGTDEKSNKKRKSSAVKKSDVKEAKVKKIKSPPSTKKRQVSTPASKEIECIAAPEVELHGLGWIRRKFSRRLEPSHHDRYWYSPKTEKRLRSMNEVRRFLECMKETDGDEDAAYEMFKS